MSALVAPTRLVIRATNVIRQQGITQIQCALLQSAAGAVFGHDNSTRISPQAKDGNSEAQPWMRYLAGGSSGISRVVVRDGGRRVQLSWVDGHESEFSSKWLEDHCTGAFNPHTRQRQVRLYPYLYS